MSPWDSIQLKVKNAKNVFLVLHFVLLCADYFEHSNPNIGCTLGRDAFETLQDEHYSGLGLYNWISSIDEGKVSSIKKFDSNY